MSLNSPKTLVLGFGLSVIVNLFLHWSVFPLEIQGHHNWRQSQTMWNVYNFAYHDNNIINPRDSQWNGGSNVSRVEFPLMQWGIAQVVRIFGGEVFVSRVLVWLIGLVGLLGFYRLLRVMGFASWLSLVATVFFQFSPVFYLYTVNIQPDMLALTASIWYVAFVFTYFRTDSPNQLVGAGLALLVATLAKLPFLMFSIISIVYFLVELVRGEVSRTKLTAFAGLQLALIAPALVWYARVVPTWTSNPILYGIFESVNSPQENLRILRFYYEQYVTYDLLSPVVWLFFLLGVIIPLRPPAPVAYGRYVWALALMTIVYLVLEWNTITTAHDYYLLPLLPWLYIVVAAGVGRAGQWMAAAGRERLARVGIGLAVLAAPATAYTLRQGYWNEAVSYRYGEFGDVLTYRRELQEVIPDTSRVIVANDNSGTIFTWLIRKQGFVFAHNSLQPHWIKDLIDNDGATHLYSNTRVVDENPEAAPLLDSLLLSRGNVRVFRLAAPATAD